MANAGDKFIIEIESAYYAPYYAPLDHELGVLYKVKGFNTLVFDDNGIKKLTPYKEKEESYEEGEAAGISATWDTAKQIIEMSPADREYLFGYEDPKFILRMFEPVEAMEILLNRQSTDCGMLTEFKKTMHDCLNIDLTTDQAEAIIDMVMKSASMCE